MATWIQRSDTSFFLMFGDAQAVNFSFFSLKKDALIWNKQLFNDDGRAFW